MHLVLVLSSFLGRKKIRKYLLVICLLFGDFKPIHQSPLINWPEHVAVRHRWFATSKQFRICKVSAWRMMGWRVYRARRINNPKLFSFPFSQWFILSSFHLVLAMAFLELLSSVSRHSNQPTKVKNELRQEIWFVSSPWLPLHISNMMDAQCSCSDTRTTHIWLLLFHR